MKQKRTVSKKRTGAVYLSFLALFGGLLLRIYLIGQGEEYTSAAAAQSSFVLSAGRERGMIYDRALRPLVNRCQKTYLAVDPKPEAAALLKKSLSPEAFMGVLPLLEQGKPFLYESEFPIEGAGVTPLTVAERYFTHQPAPHIIGYINGEGQGVCGVEAGFEEALARWGGSLSARFTVNARHRAVGSAPVVEDTRMSRRAGVVLTLDRRLQEIVEREAAVLGRGAVVLMETESGAIRAMASFPDFDVTDVGAVLERQDSPLFDRATAAWNVGSLFKICVTAAAMEAGTELPRDFFCPGYYELGDHRYHCHNRAGHGSLDLRGAFLDSCNPYFIELGERVGAARLLSTAEAMGFGKITPLVSGVTAAAGSLPAREEVTRGELANLSFGQGRLTASPVEIARMIAIVANGGHDVRPTLYEGMTWDGAFIEREPPQGERQRVISNRTAELLRRLMVGVVQEGTGKRAHNVYCGAGGKTASAQTGAFQDGEEIVHGWFGGFFPAEEPRYVLVVLQENGKSGGRVPALVFKAVSEAVYLEEHPGLARTLS